MNVLYVGDIMAEPGLKVVGQVLPNLKKEFKIDYGGYFFNSFVSG